MLVGQRLKIEIGEHIYYTPPVPPLNQIVNFGLDIEEQKFRKTPIPECFGDITKAANPMIIRDENDTPIWSVEQTRFIMQEYDKRINGAWYFIKGQPIYLTGDNYFFLNYWYFNSEMNEGYAEFRYAQTKYFYFKDLCDKDPNCFGGLYITARRQAKTESELCSVYNKITLGSERRGILMSLDEKRAKKNFDKLVRSWKRMFEPFRPLHSGTTAPKSVLMFGNPPKKSAKAKEESRDTVVLDSYIEPVATTEDAAQGDKPFAVFVDEAGTIDGMDLLDFWGTTKQALALGMKKIVGKIMMPCTLENMTPKAGAKYLELWVDSNIAKISKNGRTISGLYRYLKPYWEGLEGFVDEWGFDLKEEAIAYVEAEIEAAPDAGKKIKLRRQYPRNQDDAFNIVRGESIEGDVKLILEETLALAKLGNFSSQPCEIYEYEGDVRIKNVEPTKECLYIIEEPRPNVEYVIGIDGTATDLASQGKETADKRSEFAIVVTKKLEFGQRSYCEVAVISKIPNKREDMYRIAYLLWKYYNKYDKCLVMAESSAGNASPLLSFFTNRGAKRALMRELKYIGTDIKEYKNHIGFIRTTQVKSTQIDLLNICGRLHGSHMRHPALIENILQVGTDNTDLADAFMAAMVGWGNFGNIEHKKEIDSDRYSKMRMNRYFDQAKGKWIIKRVESTEKEVA